MKVGRGRIRPRLDKTEVLRDGLLTRVAILEIQLKQISIAEMSDREKL